MPIRGRTPKECFDHFREHVSGLIADVLGQGLHVTMVRGPEEARRDLQLGAEGANYVELSTRNGDAVPFYLAQHLRVFERPKAESTAADRFQLKTQEYWYKIFDCRPGLSEEPLFRWEYNADVPAGKQWCRHHFQIGRIHTNSAGERRALEVPLNNTTVDLNRVHVPTGFVLMEFVFRFLFTELEVVPATSVWEAKLEESEAKFFRDFSGKTSRGAEGP